jgi:hypothetical protein
MRKYDYVGYEEDELNFQYHLKTGVGPRQQSSWLRAPLGPMT